MGKAYWCSAAMTMTLFVHHIINHSTFSIINTLYTQEGEWRFLGSNWWHIITLKGHIYSLCVFNLSIHFKWLLKIWAQTEHNAICARMIVSSMQNIYRKLELSPILNIAKRSIDNYGSLRVKLDKYEGQI